MERGVSIDVPDSDTGSTANQRLHDFALRSLHCKVQRCSAFVILGVQHSGIWSNGFDHGIHRVGDGRIGLPQNGQMQDTDGKKKEGID